jgi:general secretion pathway protein N
MRFGTLLAALGALLFLIFVVALWPARIAVVWLVPDGAQLTGVSGTVWEGSAARVRIGVMDVGSLRWEASPLSFLTLSPTWQLEASRPGGFARGTVTIRGTSELEVTELELGATLDTLATWIDLAGTRGNVSAFVDELALESGRITALAGRVNLDSLQPMGLREADLGALQIDVPPGQSGPFLGSLVAVSGPLMIEEGRVEVEPGGRFLVEGLVAPKPDAPEMIAQGLQFLGQADDRGFRRFRQEGSL